MPSSKSSPAPATGIKKERQKLTTSKTPVIATTKNSSAAAINVILATSQASASANTRSKGKPVQKHIRNDLIASDTSAGTRTESKHNRKAKGPSKALTFDIVYIYSVKCLEKRIFHRAKKDKKTRKNDSPLKKNKMMTSGSGSTPDERSASTMFMRLIPATLQGDGLFVSTDIHIGTSDTKITTHRVGVDSGSWDLWLGPKYLTQRDYKILKEKKVNATINPFNYGLAGITLDQELYRDTLKIAGMTVENQEFGVVQNVPETNNTDTNQFAEGGIGILKAPPGVSSATETLKSGETVARPVASLLDNLLSQEPFREMILLICMEPWDEKEKDSLKRRMNKGKLWFGELSVEQKTNFKWTSLTNSVSCRDFFGFDLTIKDGSKTLLDKRCGIIDSGSPLVFLGKETFEIYSSKVKLYAVDGCRIQCIRVQDFKKLNPLVFSYKAKGSKSELVSFSLSPFAQVLPPSLNDLFNVPKGYLGLMVDGIDANEYGTEFIFGMPFLSRFDVAFDGKNERIGIRENRSTDLEWKGLEWRKK